MSTSAHLCLDLSKEKGKLVCVQCFSYAFATAALAGLFVRAERGKGIRGRGRGWGVFDAGAHSDDPLAPPHTHTLFFFLVYLLSWAWTIHVSLISAP